MIADAPAETNVAALCSLLGVSESGYYAWRQRDECPRQVADKQLSAEIERVFMATRQVYGSPRIQQALRREGIRTSVKRVARLMRQRGLRSIRAPKKHRKGLTQAAQNAYVAENLLQQDFSTTQPLQKWVTDTTYVPTREGWLYLVSVVDLHTRLVVGWAMGRQHDARLAGQALHMAIQRHRPPAGLILHSDRGSEFANAHYHRMASQAGLQQSMSGRGNCYDNAPAESFFASLKLEAIHDQVFASHRSARQALFGYIEIFYNRQRLHSGLGFRTPFEAAA